MNDEIVYNFKKELEDMTDDKMLIQEEETPVTKTKTKSFKRFYLEHLLESPIRVGTWSKIPWEDATYNQIETQNLVQGKKGKYVDDLKFEQFNVSIYSNEYHDQTLNKNIIEYYLIYDKINSIVGYVKLISSKYIFTNGLWNSRSVFNGLIKHFFINWLLPKYNLIVSDSVTTPSGESFWKKIISYGLSNNKEAGVYHEESDKFEVLNNVNEFDKAWNKGLFKRVYIKN